MKQGRGFLTFAQNTETVDYLRLAYLQALNIRATQGLPLTVVVSPGTKIDPKYYRAFDKIILCDERFDLGSPMANEAQALALTPYKETVKVESDLLFNDSIEHWWTAFRHRDVVLSTGCRDYRGNISYNRTYRRVFDDNSLPDVYNGLMYFRYSQTATTFFNTATTLARNWTAVRDTLKNCREDTPSTDVLFALTAAIIGVEHSTLPLDFINFTHMKSQHNQLPDDMPWHYAVMSEHTDGRMRINNLNQYHPVHYYDKSYATDELIEYYERRITQSV